MNLEEGVKELKRKKEKALGMGGPEKVAQQHKLGRYTVRERIDKLLDPDSFFEIGLLNHSDIKGMEEKTAADGKVDGFGMIDGRPVMVMANDVTVMAGSGARVGMNKYLHSRSFAEEKGYPLVNLGEAGGARLPDIQGADGLCAISPSRSYALRGRRVPMVAAIMGDSFGDPSWNAALADFVIQIKGTCMAVSGPRVLEIATHENVTGEELGGWEMHARVTGQADRVVNSEDECFELIREFLSFLPSHAQELPPIVPAKSDSEKSQQRLMEILPERSNQSYDMHEVIRTLADDEIIFPVKPEYDTAVITCLGRIDGQTVGFIANQPSRYAGAMGPEGCNKCASFICLCDSYHIPLIFLQDTPGFFVSKAAEEKGMPGRIINFLHAVSLATVPKISIVIRKAYGMAFYNMCGSKMGADFLYAWPSADISFMGAEVAVNVAHAKKIARAEDPEKERQHLIAEEKQIAQPWKAAGLGFLDDIIDPRDTRKTIIKSLELARGKSKGFSQRKLADWPTAF